MRAALETIATASREAFAPAVTESVASAPNRTAAGARTEKSILVLPFTNLSPSPDDAYFAEGLTDELITDLSRVPNVRVAPSAASFRLKNTDKDLATIGRELDVRYIVEGRVRKAGSTIRITAQLVDVAESRTVWADKYAGEFERAFELQEQVSRAIADALQLRLRPPSRATSPEAAEAYLRGRHFARQATSVGFQKALHCFQQATEFDPNYAPPFAALAEAYVNLTTAWETLPAMETMPKARAAVQRALELDQTLSEAHMVLGLVAMYEWDLRASERAFKEALRLNPASADAHKWYAALLIWLDTRYEDALRHIQAAAALDPVDPWIQVQTVWVHYFSRDYERAIEQGRQVIALEPLYGYGHYALGCALLTAGRPDEATSSFLRAIELDGRGSQYISLLGMAYVLGGQRRKALDCLGELDALDRAGRDVAFWKLHIYAGLGDAGQVVRCVEMAVEQRSSSAVFMVTHPYVDFVRRDPRFVALLNKMGLEHLATRTWKNEWKPPSPTLAPIVAAKPRIASIAVLPLDNLSADPEQEYFTDGMTESLITELAQIRSLRVISRTSVMRFKNTATPVADVARKLQVDAIVAGSVTQADDRVRVAVQLIDAATDTHIWAHSYERRLAEVLSLQREIASAIASEMSVAAGIVTERPATSRVEARARVDPDAYLEYLKGRNHWHRFIEPEVRTALEHFHAALDRDPLYAPAYGGIAICHLGLGWLGAVVPHEAFPRAKAAATRALDIDDSIAEAHGALGYVATFYEWDWSAADRALTRALELEPNSSDMHLFYAWFLNATHRHDRALAQAQHALTLDPLSPLASANVAYLAIFARDFGLAEDYARLALDLNPAYVMGRWTLGLALTGKGDHERAIAELEEARRPWSGPPMIGWLGYACARAGRHEHARALLKVLQDIPQDRTARSAEIARILVALGEHDAALAALSEACESREGVLGYIGSDFCWDPIADDDRFKAILRRIGVTRSHS